jgi:flavin-dependent dehydrogenase
VRDAAVLDAAVLGGGTAGAAAALLLARAGCAVAVLERRASPPAFTLGEGLPPTARPLLARLRLLQAVEGAHAPAYANRSAWGGDEVRDHDFIRTPHGHGWHLDRAAFDAMLLARGERAGARVLRPARLAGAPRREGGAWRLPVQGAGEMAARFVIDATGRGASFARAAGARRQAFDRLVAFWCVLPADGPGDHATLVESFAQGWWYTAPLPAGGRVVALMTDADTPAARAARTAEGFGGLLAATRHVHAAADFAVPGGAPRATGAGTARLAAPCGEGWLAVGDAALAVDPLSSQGIVTALYSAEKGAAAAYHALGGRADALPAFAATLDSIFAGYLHARATAYGAERRWPREPFWRRRA